MREENDAVEEDEPGFTNDHGILYMIGDSAEEYLQMEDRPEHLENKC